MCLSCVKAVTRHASQSVTLFVLCYTTGYIYVIIIMHIYHALISALSTHMIRIINLDMLFYVHM